jgi:putative membrane protein
MSHLKPFATCTFACLVSAPAFAHVPAAAAKTSDYSLLVVALLALAAMMYATGLARLLPHVHARRELVWRAIAFAAGWIALAIALLSPLDTAASGSFALHMIQHETLMLIAAPLLVLGRGLPTFVWAFPHDLRISFGRLANQSWFSGGWKLLTTPLSAWILHALALWLWHAPAFFNAAVRNPVVHDWQHVTFLVTALIFWHALLRHASHGARAMGIIYLFTTTIHTGVLGALLTFARKPLYASLDSGLGSWLALTPLEDQQLGGLIMWVPGALVYVSVALTLLARWIRDTEHGASSRRASGRAQAPEQLFQDHQ